MTLEWKTNPDLGRYRELETISPVTLEVDLGIHTGDIVFSFIGAYPEGLYINSDQLLGFIDELDKWFPNYQRPQNFTYDTTDSFGGNYATYGSSLAINTNVNFLIRATLSSNPAIFVDQIFTIIVENNYSSDRDACILEQFQDKDIYINGEKVTPQELIDWYKTQGYYD